MVVFFSGVAGVYAALAGVRQYDAVGAAGAVPRDGLRGGGEGRHGGHERRRGARLVERHHQRQGRHQPGPRRHPDARPRRQVSSCSCSCSFP